MAIHKCTRCGKTFEYSGNVKRCPDCRFKCALCGNSMKGYNDLCDNCRQKMGKKMRKMIECKHAGCDRMIRYDPNRAGYCREHTNWTNHGKRLAEYNRTTKKKPEHLHYRTQNDYSIDCVCKVCGKSFKARVGTVKYKPSTNGHCCSPHCVGVWAAMQTPKQDTSIEQAIEQALIRRKWPYQKQVSLCGVTIADFYLPTYNVVIYCDGEYWHSDPESVERDAKQNAVLKSNGYEVYRFTETDIKHSPDDCLDQIDLSKEPLFRQLSLPNA